MSNPLNRWALINLDEKSPSSSYFLEPRLKAMGYAPRYMGGTNKRTDVLDNAQFPGWAIICRYTSTAQLSHLWRWKRAGVKIAYFMDDDLLDPSAWQGLPWRYQSKLFLNAYRFRNQLFALIDEFWVSTPYLFKKYEKHRPLLVEPEATEETLNKNHDSVVHVCYHGTASHSRELDWLYPVMHEVLLRNRHIHFELFGNSKVAQRFRELPRTSVLHALPWAQYLAYTASRKADIGLAPLLPSRFNAARAATKVLDYSRMGAVGVYSDLPPYCDRVQHGVDGWLVPNDPQQWVDLIGRLASPRP